MIDDLTALEPPERTTNQVTDATRRTQFTQVNASLALEGMLVDAADLEIQEQVATGALSADDAVALYLRRAQAGRA